MNCPKLEWRPDYRMSVEAYQLFGKGTSWSFASIYRTPRKPNVDRRWRAYTYIEEGVHWCNSLAEAQQWVMERVTEAFAKLEECVADDTIHEKRNARPRTRKVC